MSAPEKIAHVDLLPVSVKQNDDNEENDVENKEEPGKKRTRDVEDDSDRSKRALNNASTSDESNQRGTGISNYLSVSTTDELKVLIEKMLEKNPNGYDLIEKEANNMIKYRKIFLRGLNFETTEDALRDFFAVHGEIQEAAVILDKFTNKSRGFGFVVFKDFIGANRSLKFPSVVIDGRTVNLKLAAAEREDGGSISGTGKSSGPGGFSGNRGSGSGMNTQGLPAEHIDNRKLFVRGINFQTTLQDLRRVLSVFGNLEECEITTDRVSGKSKGFAFVTFSTAVESQACIQNGNIELDGFRLGISLATEGKRPSMPPQRGQPMGYGPPGGMVMPHMMGIPAHPVGGMHPSTYGNGMYGPGSGGGYGPGPGPGGGGYGPPPQHQHQTNHNGQNSGHNTQQIAGYGAAAWGSN